MLTGAAGGAVGHAAGCWALGWLPVPAPRVRTLLPAARTLPGGPSGEAVRPTGEETGGEAQLGLKRAACPDSMLLLPRHRCLPACWDTASHTCPKPQLSEPTHGSWHPTPHVRAHRRQLLVCPGTITPCCFLLQETPKETLTAATSPAQRQVGMLKASAYGARKEQLGKGSTETTAARAQLLTGMLNEGKGNIQQWGISSCTNTKVREPLTEGTL